MVSGERAFVTLWRVKREAAEAKNPRVLPGVSLEGRFARLSFAKPRHAEK